MAIRQDLEGLEIARNCQCKLKGQTGEDYLRKHAVNVDTRIGSSTQQKVVSRDKNITRTHDMQRSEYDALLVEVCHRHALTKIRSSC